MHPDKLKNRSQHTKAYLAWADTRNKLLVSLSTMPVYGELHLHRALSSRCQIPSVSVYPKNEETRKRYSSTQCISSYCQIPSMGAYVPRQTKKSQHTKAYLAWADTHNKLLVSLSTMPVYWVTSAQSISSKCQIPSVSVYPKY